VLTRLPLIAKITLAIAAAVVLATAVVAVIVLWAAQSGFGRYLSIEVEAHTEELRPLLESYYAERGSWAGVGALMRQQTMGPPGMGRRTRMGPGTIGLLLVEANGRVAYDPTGEPSTQPITRSALSTGVPLVVEGETVGYLVIESGIQENAFFERLLSTLFWAGGLSTLLAILVGLALTRTAMRPLSDLEAATGQIRAGDLTVRVPVRTRDEVGALAERFNQMAADLEDQDRLRRRMMNDVAHELRTPLTVMQGQLEALQDGVFELNRDNLVPVHEQTLLLRRLVNDLRDVALAESGQITLDMGPVELASLVRRVAGRFDSQARTQGIDLLVSVQEPLPLIQGDGQRLEQVMNNLLSNALRHTPAGGSVTLGLAATASGVRITVKDTGEGIAPEDLGHIFERFYRGDPARQRADGHSGLGLAIARELVRAHGGEISVASVQGQGTTVTVDLPVQSA
jgi:signal transduction histidine kinase